MRLRITDGRCRVMVEVASAADLACRVLDYLADSPESRRFGLTIQAAEGVAREDGYVDVQLGTETWRVAGSVGVPLDGSPIDRDQVDSECGRAWVRAHRIESA